MMTRDLSTGIPTIGVWMTWAALLQVNYTFAWSAEKPAIQNGHRRRIPVGVVGRNFPLVERTPQHSAAIFRAAMSPNESNTDNSSEEKANLPDPEKKTDENAFDLDVFLDTPFFDPQEILRTDNDADGNSWQRRFAMFVRDDYETAELILSGTLVVVLIVVSQELLRVQFYGWDNYIPFSKGVNPGRLF